jgi:signal transduction histidine kinase
MIPIPEGPELRDLTTSFNDMSCKLRQIHDTLETRIAERTGALKDLNVALEKDNAALQQAREEILRKNGQLRSLAKELARIQEVERQSLGRDLHDQVCQNLAALSLSLETMKLTTPHESTRQVLSRIDRASVLVDQTYETAKELMEDLRPSVLIEYGYLTGLRQWASQLTQRTGLVVDVRGEASAPRLAPHVEMALFRIAQEALNNAAQHAKATRVVVTEEMHDDSVHLTIADNGIGFDQSRMKPPEGGLHWGLMNMSERALAVGGTCRIDSRPGGGTRVIVEVNR